MKTMLAAALFSVIMLAGCGGTDSGPEDPDDASDVDAWDDAPEAYCTPCTAPPLPGCAKHCTPK